MGIFIDFSKAFDTIRHDILLHKLKHYGIRGLAYDLISDYLSNRKQFVIYDAKHAQIYYQYRLEYSKDLSLGSYSSSYM